MKPARWRGSAINGASTPYEEFRAGTPISKFRTTGLHDTYPGNGQGDFTAHELSAHGSPRL